MPTLFEIHLTTTELDETRIREFVKFCGTIDAKPILIELPVGQQRQQPMISKVVKLENAEGIHPIIAELEAAFVAAGFPVARVKVEVPLEYEAGGRAAFPEFCGGYYEWHGRVQVVDAGALAEICRSNGLHLSRSALRGKAGARFVTLRNFDNARRFTARVEAVKAMLERNGFLLEKDEAECCVYDSNKAIDRGWSDVPEYTDSARATQLAIDGFMRRAAAVGGPFMAKGSVIMRQYLPDPTQRPAEDIDFVYLGEADEATAAGVFTDWLTRVTEAEVGDDIVFRSFTENAFWRGIDYAMNDDFPTTNTDLMFTLPGREPEEIGLDLSWNLPLPDAPVHLRYRPLTGEPFDLASTVPLSLQIAWKLHQTVVRPRCKDLTDLTLLLAHPAVNRPVLKKAANAYQEECKKDGIPPGRLGFFVGDDSASWALRPAAPPARYFRSYLPDPTGAARYLLPEDFGFYDSNDLNERMILEVTEQFGEALRSVGFSDLVDLSPTLSVPEAEQIITQRERPAVHPPISRPRREAKKSWWERLFG